MRKNIVIVVLSIAVVLGFTVSGAVATGLIGHRQLRVGAVHSDTIKDGSIRYRDFNADSARRLTGPKGERGATGPQGSQGDNGLTGAYYAVAYYDVGDTNAGAIATVACAQQSDTAVSGGVQVLGIGGTQDEVNAANQRNTPVSSSFPGRMDWGTNSPRPNRLDGWIVQFGGNAGAASDKAPEKAKVWALCVPDLSLEVVQTYHQSADNG